MKGLHSGAFLGGLQVGQGNLRIVEHLLSTMSNVEKGSPLVPELQVA